jgi:hypothetical protein
LDISARKDRNMITKYGTKLPRPSASLWAFGFSKLPAKRTLHLLATRTTL